jgi:hypothetical protein
MPREAARAEGVFHVSLRFQPQGLLARALALVVGLVVVVLVLVFSLVLFAAVAVVAAIALAWGRWRARSARPTPPDVIDIEAREVQPRERP